MDVPEWLKQKSSFFKKHVEINIDGLSETWELEEVRFGESNAWVKYKLKSSSKYETGV